MAKHLLRAGEPGHMVTETDGQGRIYLPKEVREEHGERYHVVTYRDRIELVPVSDDALEAVRESVGDIDEATVEEVRAAIDSAAGGDDP